MDIVLVRIHACRNDMQ